MIHRPQGESLHPKRLALNGENRALCTDLIALFQRHLNHTQGDLNQQLQVLEGDDTDYRIKRGLAHILRTSFSTFEPVSPLEPGMLRERVFAIARQTLPSPENAQRHLETLALQLGQELDQEITAEQIRSGLYADLQENHILISFDAPTPDALIHRYNLSQVQGIFYRASEVVLNVYRNDPGEYKLMFRYLKLFRLMAYVEGDADHGFTVTIDGPTSLFKPSTRYGLDMAKLIPAILHVTRWSLTATLHSRDRATQQMRERRFTLSADCDLVSHYPPGKPYDSLLEESFANRWPHSKTPWQLEREVDLIPIPGSVMIPDFRLVHPDGRTYLLEIVGYWRPEYLRKQFAQVRRADRNDLILAISDRLNLEKAGVSLSNVPAQLVWFKEKLSPKAVLDCLEP